MHQPVVPIVVLFTVCAGFAQIDSFEINGAMRSYMTHAPSGLSSPALLMSLHGATGDATLQQTRTQFNKISDREKFIVVYPNSNFTNAAHYWNDQGDEDIPFLLALIDSMDVRFGIDRSRVYCTGFSLGGMMTHRLACRAADKIAAIASVSGPNNNSDCAPSRPISVMHIHGTADQTIDYSSGIATAKQWALINGCPGYASLIDPYPPSKTNAKSKKEIFGPCNQNAEVVLILVDGVDHAWPKSTTSDIDASEEIWAFLKTHSLGTTDVLSALFRPNPQPFTASYHSGKIFIRGEQGVRRVDIFDMQGRRVGSVIPDLASCPSPGFEMAIARPMAGMHLVRIEGTRGVHYIRWNGLQAVSK